MIPRDHFKNKIRSLGYSFKSQRKRISLWRKSGSTAVMSVPHTKFLEDEYVKSVLRQAGCTKEEIEAFIASAKS